MVSSAGGPLTLHWPGVQPPCPAGGTGVCRHLPSAGTPTRSQCCCSRACPLVSQVASQEPTNGLLSSRNILHTVTSIIFLRHMGSSCLQNAVRVQPGTQFLSGSLTFPLLSPHWVSRLPAHPSLVILSWAPSHPVPAPPKEPPCSAPRCSLPQRTRTHPASPGTCPSCRRCLRPQATSHWRTSLCSAS